MNFYAKASKRRNKIASYLEISEYDVLSKLMAISLANDESPYELPNTFQISDILITKENFKKLLKDLGCKVQSVDYKYENNAIGNSFKVTLKD